MKRIVIWISICLIVFSITFAPVTVSASKLSIAEAESLCLPADSVPECISYNSALAAGHIQRMYTAETELDCAIFKNQNNTNTLYIFDENIKYIGPQGNIYDKSNLLVQNKDGSYRNVFNDVLVEYSLHADSGIKLHYDCYQLDMIPNCIIDAKLTTSSDAKTTSIAYPKVFGSETALIYSQTYSGFKEEIVLFSRQELNNFSFIVNTYGSKLSVQDNTLIALYDGTRWGEFGSIFAYDANNVMVDGDLHVTEIDKNQSYLVTISIPSDFLNNENTTYPVIIDPSFKVAAGTNNVINDTTIFSNHNGVYGTSSFLFVGNQSLWSTESNKYGRGRTLIKFPELYSKSSFATRYNAGLVTEVYLNFADIDCQSGPYTLTAQICTVSWDEATAVNNHNLWNSGSSVHTSTSVLISPQDVEPPYPRYELSILPFLNYWYSGQIADNGIILKNSDETNRALVFGSRESGTNGGLSTSKPYITVVYSDMPTSESEYLQSNGIYQFYNVSTGKALTYSNNTISLQTSNPASTTQHFKLLYHGSGHYKIEPVNAPGKVITYGSPVGLNTPSTLYSEFWWFVVHGNGFRIYSRASSTRLLSYNSAENEIWAQNTTENSTWQLNYLGLNVPLLEQEANNTCSAAAARMILHYNGYTHISESNYIQAAGGIDFEHFNYVYNITNTLNSLLATNGNTTEYSYLNVGSYSQNQTVQILSQNITNMNPVIVNIKVTSSNNSLPYTTNGHYVVVTGIYRDINTGAYMAIINDPHYAHCNTVTLPMAELYTYMQAGNNHIIRVN